MADSGASLPGRDDLVVERTKAEQPDYLVMTTLPPLAGTSSTQVCPAGTLSGPAFVDSMTVESSRLCHVPRTTRPPWKSSALPVPVKCVSGTGLPAGSL